MHTIRPKGIAIVIALVAIAIISGVMTLMFSRMIGDMRHSADNTAIIQTLMLARGAANVGSSLLGDELRDRLAVQVNQDLATSTNPWSYGNSTPAPNNNPEPISTAQALDTLATSVQTQANDLFCNLNAAPNNAPSGVSVSLRVYFTPTACGLSLPPNTRLPDGRFISGGVRGGSNPSQIYALPFVLVAEATQGVYKRNVVIQGEYQFTVGQASFARWAYFTNRRLTGLYFSTGELVDGPVHSNQYLRFSGTPWFGQSVTVAGCANPSLTTCGNIARGDFFNGVNGNNLVRVSQMSPNSTRPCWPGDTCPTFAGGVDWNASFIPLPPSTSLASEAANQGLFLSGNLTLLELYAGDNNGNYLTRSGSTWTPNPAPFQYIRSCTGGNRTNPTGCNLYRYSNSNPTARALMRWNGSTWVQAKNPANVDISNFNGVIHTTGTINLRGPARVPASSTNPDTAPPALASFAQITVANNVNPSSQPNVDNRSIRVVGDLKYETPPCTGSPQWVGGSVQTATCNNPDAQNILGVYSQTGDLTFGTGDSNTPRNLTVQGVFMSGSQRVGVYNYDGSSGDGDDLRILGGLIGETVSGFRSGNSGYDRKITYDQRLLTGVAPPAFPTTTQADVTSVTLTAFGQREQVY